MSRRNIVRMTSAGFVVGGVLVAGWGALSPWGSFAGAARGASEQWVVAHTCHYLAALFLMAGLLGLAVQRLERADAFETVAQLGFLVALWMYGGTGAITSAVWPLIARDAGHIVEPGGAMFHPPEALSVNAVLALSVALALVAAAMRRARLLPLPAMGLMVLGAALFWFPTAPLRDLPWIFFPAAAVCSGAGLAWLGWSLRDGAVPVAETVPAAAPPSAAVPA
jgi:hypothetical protein